LKISSTHKLNIGKDEGNNQLGDLGVDRRTPYSKSYLNEVYERELDRPGSIHCLNF
jgi:hypothetical protein